MGARRDLVGDAAGSDIKPEGFDIGNSVADLGSSFAAGYATFLFLMFCWGLLGH